MRQRLEVMFVPASPDGCAWYRLWLPHIHTPNSGFAMVDPRKPVRIESFYQFPRIVCQRQMSKDNYKSLEMLRSGGVKVIYDLDDNLWNIPPWNPMRTIFMNNKLANGMEPCLKLCAHVTVSTPLLKKLVEQRIGNAVPVTVVENAVDLNMFVRSRKSVKRDYVVVGWAGSNTHDADTLEAMEALARLMQRRPDIRVHIMGLELPKPLRRSSLEKQVKLSPFMPVWEFPAWWSNVDWDIALAPLIEHEFNDAKSSCKLQEAGALSIPCLASCVTEYKKFCAGDPILEQLLTTGTRSDWTQKIERLVDDIPFRLEAGRCARKRVEERYNIVNRAQEWAKVFSSL